MKFLIAEDDLISRKVMQNYLGPYGEGNTAVDGREALDAFNETINSNEPYDLICMDIMMPKMDGMQAVKEIREIEKRMDIKSADRVKIIIISAVENPKNVFAAIYEEGSFGYLYKPVSREDLVNELRRLGLID